MKQLFSRWLLMTALVLGATTAMAQKSVLDENFANGKPAGWETVSGFWKFQDGNAIFQALVENGKDTLIAPEVSLAELDNKPSVALTYSNVANNDKLNTLTVLYRAASTDEWAELVKFDAAADQANWKGELPEGLNKVQIALAGAYLGGVETRVYRLAIENKTEGTEAPTGLKVNGLTTTSVSIEWNACSSPKFVQYNIKVSTTALANPSVTGGDVADESLKDEWYSNEELSPNTEYWFYVQYDCNDGDLSPWAELSFRTPCEAFNAPFVENFEGELSNCHTLIGTQVSAEYAYNSTKALKSYSAQGTYNYFILPEFNGDVKSQQISFMAAALEGGSTYARTVTIGVCPEPTAEHFTQVKTLDLPKGRQWESIVVSLAGYKDSGKYIALKFGNEEKANRIFVDNIKVEIASQCPKPMFVEVNEITPNSAKIKWVETGDASEWNLVISTEPLNNPEDILDKETLSQGEYVGRVNANPYTAINLQSETTYYVYVQGGCGKSEWTNAISFTTGKAIAIPFVETFDRFDADFYTNDANAIPEGWTNGARNMNPNSITYDRETSVNVPFVSTDYDHTASAYKTASLKLITDLYNRQNSVQNTGYVILPAMPQALGDLKITFWAYMPNKAGVYLRVCAASTQDFNADSNTSFAENITPIDSVMITNADSWAKYTIKLDKYSGTATYLVLNLSPIESTEYNATGSATCVAYIDDLTIAEIGTCGEVFNIATEATSNSIKLAWESTSAVTNTFRVKVATKQIDPTAADGDVVANKSVTGKTYTATGLSVDTKYYFYITPACDEVWEEVTKTTNSTLSVPYFTDFSGEVTGKVATRGPKGWTKGNINVTTALGNQSQIPYLETTALTNVPSNVTIPYLYFTQTTAIAQNGGYVVTPELEGVDAKDLTLTFTGYYNNTSTGVNYPIKNGKYGVLYIGTVDQLSDIKLNSSTKRVTGVTFAAAVRCSAAKTPETFVVKMPASAAGKYIVFYSDTIQSTSKACYNYFCVDNLYIVKSSGPQVLTNLAVSNIEQTSAKLTWTENGSATKWNVKIFTSEPADPDTETAVKSFTVETNPTTTINDLSHSTQYFVYVQAQVGEEKGFWASTSFWTATGTWSLPFVETFNNYPEGSETNNTLPAYYDISASTYKPWVQNMQSNGGALDGYGFNMQTTSGKKISQLVFPQFDVPVKNLQMTLYAQGYLYINYQTYTLVGVMEGSNFVAIDSFMVKHKSEWTEFHFDFSKYTGNGTQIAIRQDNDASNLVKKESTYIKIDNIRIDAIPDCGRVKDISFINVTDKSATATWSAVNGETEWRIKVSNSILANPETQEGNVLAATTVTTNSYALQNLYDGSDYYVYVQSKKGDNYGQWSVPALLHTNCAPMALPATWDFNSYTANNEVIPGNECLSFVGTSRDLKQVAFSYKQSPFTTYHLALAQETKTDANYIVFPEMNVDDISKLQVSMKIKTGGTTASKSDRFEIGIMYDPKDASTFTPVCTESLTQRTDIYDRTYVLSGYHGDSQSRFGKYIAIHIQPSISGTTESVGKIYIDDICVDYIPACAKPIDVTASNVDEDGATLSWSAEAAGASFDVRLLSSADGDKDEPLLQTVVNGATTVDLDLSSNTQYYAFVRKQCSEDSYSDWSAPCAFRTNCGTVQALPYSDDFEAYANNAVPACWTKIIGGGSGGPCVSTSSVKDGVNGLKVTYSSTSGQYATKYTTSIITPKLDINSAKDLIIVFDMKGGASNTELRIDAIEEATKTASYVTITTLKASTTWQKVYLKVSDIETYTSNNEYKYIQFAINSNAATVHIDNLILSKDATVALPVTNMAVTAVTDESISFSFQEVTPGVESWQVAYGKHGEFTKPDKSVSGTVIDATTHTITGLEGNTEYDIYVRANASTVAWEGPITAKTANAPAAIPYNYAFEDADENANLWTLTSARSGNDFIIGDAATCGATGEKALYISNDGASYAYNLKMGWTWALRDIRFDKTGNHTISIRAKVPGNAEANQDQDALYAILVPAGAKVGIGDGSIRDYENIYLLNGKAYKYNSGDNAADNVYRVFNREQKINDWTLLETKVNIAQTGDYTLALIWFSNTFGTAGKPAAIDEIEIKQYECTAVSQLKLESVATDQASFSWFAGECKNFEYVLSRYSQLNNPAGIDDVDKVASGTTAEQQIQFSNLQPATNYSLYVRTLCVGEETDWAECKFSTPCSAESLPYMESFAEKPDCWIFNQAAVTTKRYQSEEMSEAEEWSVLKLNAGGYAILPEFDEPINQLNVEVGLFCSLSLGAVEIGVLDNVLDVTGFQALARFQAENQLESECLGSCGNPYIIETFKKMLNLYQGTGRVLAIRNAGSDVIYLKHVFITKLPDCITPQQIEFTQVQENQVTINWLAGTEEQWEIKVDDNEPFSVTTNPYVLTGLEQGSIYSVSVRAICDAEHASEWSVPVFVQTTCGVNSLPLLEDFSGLKRNSVARLTCWDNLYSNDSIKYVFSGVETLHSTDLITNNYFAWASNMTAQLGDYRMLCSHVPNNSSDNKRFRWFISPQFAIEGDATLSFDARHCNAQKEAVATVGRFYVAISTDNGATWQEDNAENLTPQLTAEFTNISIALDKFKGQNIRVAFYHEALDNRDADKQTYLLIDNVRINCTDTYPIADNVCESSDYENNGFVIKAEDLAPANESKVFKRFELADETGCDRWIELTLTTRQASPVETQYATICHGDVYEFGPYELKESNPEGQPYHITTENIYGCDSTINLFLTVTPSDTIRIKGATLRESDLPYVYENEQLQEPLTLIPAGTPLGDYSGIKQPIEGLCFFIDYELSILCDIQTIEQDPVVINDDQLPYVVDEHYTIPEGTQPGTFTQIVDIDDCTKYSYDVTINSTATGIINISGDMDHVDVYDMLGRKVVTLRQGDEQHPLPAGVYTLISVTNSGKAASSRVTVK